MSSILYGFDENTRRTGLYFKPKYYKNSPAFNGGGGHAGRITYKGGDERIEHLLIESI